MPVFLCSVSRISLDWSSRNRKDPTNERLNWIAPWRAGQGECRPGNAQRARPPHLFESHEKTAEMVEARKALREVANLEDNFYLATGVY